MPRRRALLLCPLLAACTGGEPARDTAGGDGAADTGTSDAGVPDPVGDPSTVALDGDCPLSERLGGFVVESNPTFGAVDGSVLDGVVPVTVLTEVAVEGDCRLLRRENPRCEPGCDPDETCDFDGTCIAYPTGIALGTVTVGGLAEDVIMEPSAPANTYYDTTLPTPAFEAGALVELRTEGGALEPVALHGVGFEPVELGEATWPLVAGSPFAATWSPPTAAVHRATVRLTVNVDQHGTTPAFLVCDFADDGAGEVPAALVDAFLGAGVSGYPNGSLERRTVDRADVTGGCVDFEVRWVALPAEVTVDGHTPCDDPGDCPPGHPCDLETETCL